MSGEATAERSASGERAWLIGLGTSSLVLGFSAFFMTRGLTLAGVIWYGALLIVLGVGLVIETVASKQRPRRWLLLGCFIWLQRLRSAFLAAAHG